MQLACQSALVVYVLFLFGYGIWCDSKAERNQFMRVCMTVGLIGLTTAVFYGAGAFSLMFGR